MKVTIHQSRSETTEPFLLDPEGLPWHLCRYPERPGVWRCKPGTACETPCEAIALGLPELPKVTPEYVLEHPFASPQLKDEAREVIAAREGAVTDADVKAAGEPPAELVDAMEKAVEDDEKPKAKHSSHGKSHR